jgi:metallo-beta-lactamase class B
MVLNMSAPDRFRALVARKCGFGYTGTMIRLVLVALGAALLFAPARAQDTPQRVEWNRPFVPFTLVGNVHYVGTAGLSAYLVTGPRGHVLIDGGLPESAPLIAANITHLGYRLRDVKYLLINHTHYDHAGGLAALKRLTGAKLVATPGERGDLVAGRSVGRPDLARFPAVKPDRIVGDGDHVVLGPIVLTAHLTPGHTRGGVSWTMTTAGKRVIFATSLTVAGQKLVGDPAYPRAAADFRATFAKLRAMRADVFLNFHPEFFDMSARRARQVAGDANAFVDPGALGRQVTAAELDFAASLAAR